ncbi:CsbD family protein [Streptococcus cuniculipharyngis]|uniref:CsbD family protein n=1 Tax=Streptococcus cuniculipharyngis TaxID=1562651 RepID=A0A5C5SBZ2_9STRE|nr:CsbD family protein [Streptococcus cuniculipharyngis]TWS98069.1 CsbD family protein [Streptococcus cuniculipharyngis]
MSEEKLNAKLEQVAGGVKEAFGKVTGDKATETEGQVGTLAGKAKETLEDVKDTVKGALSGLSKD